MKKFKRLLAVALVLCMVLGVMPLSTFAAETSGSDTDFIRVFHLDVGRKYFTVAQVTELIDLISEKGYTHMELAIGNDGLRFLLDDMSVTVGETTYNSEDVAAGVKEGNKNYSHSGEWSQTEMDQIVSYAESKHIEIIPLVNNPGHMDSILAAMEAVDIDGYYAGSSRTVDLENAEAVAFTQALVLKYAKYFQSKGCTYFNIGADEYANDYHTADSTGMGFGYLIDNDKYGNFITYVNALVDNICKLGMTPIAFNDGIYFREDESFGTFDTRLLIAAWSGGWGGIKPASTSFLVEKGHQILNTNERWYYVLGRAQSVNSTYCYESALSNAKSVSVTSVTDNTGAASMGAMQCVWCDDPSVDYETYKANVVNIINAMADNNPDYFVPYTAPEVTDNDVTVSADGVETLTAKKQETSTPTLENYTASVTYDIQINGGEYHDAAEIKIPYDPVFNGCNRFVGIVDGKDIFPVSLVDGYFVGTVPHFSEVEIDGRAVDAGDTITSSGSGVEYVLAEDGVTGGNEYVIVNTSSNGTGYALTNNSSATPGSTSVTISNGKITNLTEANDDNVIWTISGSTSGTVKNGSYYVYLNNNTTILSTSSRDLTISDRGDGEYRIYYSTGSWINRTTYYLRYSNSSWGRSSSTSSVYLFEKVNTTAYKVTPALQEQLITENTVDNDGYTDVTWTAYENALKAAQEKLAEVEKATYTTEAAANTALEELEALVDALVTAKNALAKAVEITINYKTSDGIVVKTETRTVADNATTVLLTSPVYDDEGNTYVLESSNLTLQLPISTYTVTVKYVEEDLTSVDPLIIEYWITNIRPMGTSSNQNYLEIKASDSNVYSENGADISTLVESEVTYGSRRQIYWQTKLLDVTKTNDSTSGTEEQTLYTGDDETLSGSAITRVRYWSGLWQVLTGDEWVTVNRDKVSVTDYTSEDSSGTTTRETHQLVAYYMEVIDIQNANNTTELEVNTADWGKKGDGTPYDDYLDPNSTVSVSIQIIYDDGSGNPANDETTGYPSDEGLQGKTIVYGYWSEGRGIGTMLFKGEDQFQIYKVTAETGSHSATGSTWEGVTVSDFEWDNNAVTVWQGNPTSQISIGNPARTPNKDGIYENLMWDKNHEAILIRVYVKTIENADSLTVRYFDRTAGNLQFYNYPISVSSGVVFNEGFALGSATNTLVNNEVTNIYGAKQTVSADLKTMPEVAAYYRYCNYTCVEVKRSEDGKTVDLYYTFTPVSTFVADFGLPIKITPVNLNQEGYTTSGSEIVAVKVIGSYDTEASTNANAAYGTITVDGTTVTYTPNTVMADIDFFTIFVQTGADGAGIAYRCYILPATTVYYEEGFLENWSGTWTDKGTKHSFANQTAQILGSSTDNYGYDSIITSNGSDATTSTIGASATFTFIGTGFDLYANCDGNTGYVLVEVRDSANVLKRVFMVNTKVATAENATDATSGQTGAFKSLPVVTLEGLTHGAYTVTVKKITDEKAINIDGFRIYGTIKEDITTNEDGTVTNNSIYKSDLEDNPEFHEIRDNVLNGVDIKNSMYNYKKICSNANGYYDISGLAQYIHGQVYTADSTLAGALVMSGENAAYDAAALKDLLDNGPKNELFLYPNQTLTFSVTTNRVMQIGLKAPQGATKYSISYKVGDQTTAVATDKDISTSVDMFYDVVGQATSVTEYTVTITNAGTGILSVTDLKICDDPNATFNALTAADIEAALNAMGYADAEPENPETPAAPEDSDDSKTPEDPKATCADHKGGTATCKDKAVCTVCGEAYGELDAENHTGEAKWSHTDGKHSKAYDCCGKVVVAEEAHKLTDGKCECGYEAPASDDNSQTSDNNQTSDNSQTGDNSHVVLFGSLLVISALAAIVLLVPDVRKKLIK